MQDQNSLWQTVKVSILACLGFLRSQQVAPCLFAVLACSDIYHWSLPGPVVVTILWCMIVIASLCGLCCGCLAMLFLLRSRPGSELKQRRYRVHVLLFVLHYGLITAWGVVSLMGSQNSTLTSIVMTAYSLWFWNAMILDSEQRKLKQSAV